MSHRALTFTDMWSSFDLLIDPADSHFWHSFPPSLNTGIRFDGASIVCAISESRVLTVDYTFFTIQLHFSESQMISHILVIQQCIGDSQLIASF